MVGSARSSEMYFDVVSSAPRTDRELSEEKQGHLLLLFIAFIGAIVSRGFCIVKGGSQNSTFFSFRLYFRLFFRILRNRNIEM